MKIHKSSVFIGLLGFLFYPACCLHPPSPVCRTANPGKTDRDPV